jgi:CHAD domain-containing protein
MKPSEELFSSFDQHWTQFSRAWKKTRHKASEKSVHDLRVNTRRLIENLELARVLSKQNNVSKLKRRFKKLLKEMGALRDLQVQLETVSHAPRSPAITDFTQRLERRERREIENIQNDLKGARKRRLTDEFKDVLSEFVRSQASAGVDRTRHSVRRILTLRQNEFLKAKRRFNRSQPHSEEALHEMRIALKKLRYAMEAAQPVLAESEKARMRAMRGFQKLMGDSRDLEMLRVELEEWAQKRGKKMAVVPTLQHLEEKREALLNKVRESSHELETILETKSSTPVAETTQVVRPAATGAAAAKAGSSPAGTAKNPT